MPPSWKIKQKVKQSSDCEIDTYKSKAKAYESRFGLSNIYMTEDLCRSNQAVVKELLKYNKADTKLIAKFWTIDGKIRIPVGHRPNDHPGEIGWL